MSEAHRQRKKPLDKEEYHQGHPVFEEGDQLRPPCMCSGSHKGGDWTSVSCWACEGWLHILPITPCSRLPALSWQKALRTPLPNSPQENREGNIAVILKTKLQITFLVSADHQGCIKSQLQSAVQDCVVPWQYNCHWIMIELLALAGN